MERLRDGRIGVVATVFVLAAAVATYLGLRHSDTREINWPWTPVAVNGDRLVITYAHGDCDRERGYVVTEDAGRVLLAVRVQPWNGHGLCTAAEQVRCHVVQLQQPLGTRSLLNPTLDPPVKVGQPRVTTAPAESICGSPSAQPTSAP